MVAKDCATLSCRTCTPERSCCALPCLVSVGMHYACKCRSTNVSRAPSRSHRDPGITIPNPKPLSCSASMHLPHDTACFATTPTFQRESHFWRCNACVGSLPVRDEFDPLQKTSQRFSSKVGINTFAMSRFRWNALCLQARWDRDSIASSRRWVGSETL